jgi:hypothetical protein
MIVQSRPMPVSMTKTDWWLDTTRIFLKKNGTTLWGEQEMALGDLSGQVNGLIIFSSLSFALTLYTQGRQREDKKMIQDMVQTLENIINKSFPLYANQDISNRYDLLSSKKLGSFSIEIVSLFIIIIGIAVLKATDATCNSGFNWNNVGCYSDNFDIMHNIILHISITVLSFVFLAWIICAGIHAIFVRTVTHRHDAAVRRFHSDLKVIDPSIDDKIDSTPRFSVSR